MPSSIGLVGYFYCIYPPAPSISDCFGSSVQHILSKTLIPLESGYRVPVRGASTCGHDLEW